MDSDTQLKRGTDVLAQSSVFLWIATATGAMLLLPAIASQFTAEVRWSATDFVLMGLLLFSTGSLFVLVARKLPRKHRLVLAALFFVAFLYVCAELAVGVFTNLGS